MLSFRSRFVIILNAAGHASDCAGVGAPLGKNSGRFLSLTLKISTLKVMRKTLLITITITDLLDELRDAAAHAVEVALQLGGTAVAVKQLVEPDEEPVVEIVHLRSPVSEEIDGEMGNLRVNSIGSACITCIKFPFWILRDTFQAVC